MSNSGQISTNKQVWIFLGPSLSVNEAEGILPAHYAPPIRRGDIDKALKQGARVLGIIDGSFYRSFSVSPFEIVSALRQGAKVFGGSSMGALKAVECESFGMVGVGKIFEWYQTGKIEAEDEVALTFDPDSLKSLCDPLVNMRHAFSLAVEKKLIGPKEKTSLLRTAKRIYFPERTYRLLFSIMGKKGFSPRKLRLLNAFTQKKSCDLKALDAIACLQAIRRYLETSG